MESPLQLEVHGIKSTDHVREMVEKNLSKIEKRYGRATACRVVVRAPGGNHQTGEPFDVSVRIALPARREINVGRAPDERGVDLDFAINDAFKRALRQLSDETETMNDSRRHATKSLNGEA
ncbi:MAG TPA: HPF/RaiA family ribosome-associated protein [Rhizomicrobium sp.]|nr:HPF/RaiA family ribosome-associated protein [Rhizomicrobium sp.]